MQRWPRKMIVDVDTGVDDAQALMMALSDESTQVLAVTCVAGNCSLDAVFRNTCRVLNACGISDVNIILTIFLQTEIHSIMCILSRIHDQNNFKM